MNMAERIPGMDDKDLATLHQNARRLEQAGAPGQQKAAAEMLPLIEAELATRLAAKPKPVRKAPVRKKPAAKAAAAA